MTPVPPSAPRAIWIIARAALQRRINRIRGNMSAAFNRKKSSEPVERRKGTSKKGQAGGILLLFVGGIFLFNGVNLSSQFVRRLGERIDFQDSVVVGEYTYRQIEDAAKLLREAERLPPDSVQGQIQRKDATERLKEVFKFEMQLHLIPEEQQPARVTEMMDIFKTKGADGFQLKKASIAIFFPTTDSWTLPENQTAMQCALGLTLLLVEVAMLFMTLGNMNADLGKVEWSMEWLFTFPVPARVLFLAKILEVTLGNPLMWFCAFPLTFVMYWCAGFEYWALPLGLAVTLYLSVILASIYAVAETWLRKKLPPTRLKNIQAVFTLFATLLFFLLIWTLSAPAALPYVVDAAKWMPANALWNPASVPILLTSRDHTLALAALCILLVGVLVPFLSVRISERLVRDGLLGASGTYTGTRGRANTREWPGGLRFQGILGKELRLLFRDRNFLVQTLVVPVMGLGFQMIMSPHILKSAAGDLRHASTLAFGLGAYVLMFSAFQVLSVEGNALWMLYTFPRDLSEILLKKTRLWCGFASLYTITVLLVCAIINPALNWTALSPAVTALVGVVIYSYIASGIGVLGTDPLETEVQRKIRPEMMYLYMLLVSFFAWAIYSPSMWSKFAQMILSTLLAVALWQKVRDRAPFMLDPTEEAPPSIALADGMIAVLAFFVLQGLMGFLLMQTKIPLGAQLVIAFVTAGILVGMLALYTFWRQKVPNLLATVGFRSAVGEKRASYVGAFFLGICGGCGAGLFGMAYLWMTTWFEPLRALKEESLKLAMHWEPTAFWWLAGLAVFAAPVFEEFIFRGLVYKGLRRSAKPYVAVLASAGVFAIVHPPLSVVPVFVLGVTAAVCFERSRLLLAPIMAHMVYNALMVAVQ